MAHRDREFALIKVTDDVVRGEQFWIIELHRVSGTVTRSEAPIDVATAETQLRALGCDTWTIAQMLRDARDVFNGLGRLPSGVDGHTLRG